jgi:pimeloyl-ACP methyl ester carboxylesterase
MEVSSGIEPHDERIRVADGLELRVLRWVPAGGGREMAGAEAGDAAGAQAAPVLLVHGLASNARLWDGVDFAVRHPDLTRGIVLVDGGLTDLRDAFPTWEICWDRLAPPPLVGLPLSSVEGYFRTNHADWPEEGFEGSLGNFEIRPDRTIAPWLSREHHKAILEAMWGQRIADLWRSLRVPALVVPVDGGESDWTAAKRAGAEAAQAAAAATGVPVRVQWFKGDHDIHAQRPAEVAEAILAAERDGLFSTAGTGTPAAAADAAP